MNTDQSSTCLEDLLREYLTDLKHRVTAAHHRNVRVRLRKALDALGVPTVEQIRALEIIRYRNGLKDSGSSNRTANLVVDSLRAMFTWAVECALIDAAPFGKIRRLPDGAGHQRCVRRALTDEEIKQFLGAARADDDQNERRWATKGGGEGNRRRTAARVPQVPLWRALVETGARWSELTRSSWDDADLEKRALVLRAANTKARKRRVVPIGTALVSELRRLRDRLADEDTNETDPSRIFLTPEGANWSRSTNNAMRILNRLLVRAGIERVDAEGRKIDIHALRHTFGSRMARNGAGLVHVQRLMGHSDPKLTAQVYTHLDIDDLRCAVDSALGE